MEESIFSTEQQDDLRGLLQSLQVYFKECNDLFKESEVLVGPHVACISIPLGDRPPETDDRANNARSQRGRDIRAALTEFYRELASTGAPLIQFQEETETAQLARYRLVPNDPIGAERLLAKTLKLLRARRANP